MALLNIKCPSCNEKILVDDSKEKGFCLYCGAKLWVKDEIQRFHDEDSWGYHASKWKQRQQKYRNQVDPVVNIVSAIVIVIAVITIIWIVIGMAS